MYFLHTHWHVVMPDPRSTSIPILLNKVVQDEWVGGGVVVVGAGSLIVLRVRPRRYKCERVH